jgi:bifunctional non-homologous end joining protein LigD
MTLAKYQKKRHFDQTPEPRGTAQKSHGSLRFVVQKHAASRLHYDFRLELDGTLKSWALPKGPSLNPADKRLAIMVEDHPLEYRTFEGTIPEGNYGAGTVMVWDEGNYAAAAATDLRDSERLLREGLEKGHLTFVLNGHKLKGEFALVKLRRSKEKNAWLLLKKGDSWATDADVTKRSESVQSGRSLDEIARSNGKVWKSGRAAKSRSRPRIGARHVAGPTGELDLGDAPKERFPGRIRPMLAHPVAAPFDRTGWLFEVKWDGYRAIAEVDGQRVALYSRNHQPYEHRFAPVVESLRRLGHRAVLDGEIVVVDGKGRSQFQLLQNYQTTGKGTLLYYVFDLLYLDGRDLRRLPLRRRKVLLQQILGDLPNVRLSEHIEEQGVAFFQAAAAQGIEGVMAKEAQSRYQEGLRSHCWLKIKAHRRQEAIICGYTEPRGSRAHLGALVLGVYKDKELVHVGHAGGGFDGRMLEDLGARLDPLVQSACPFRKKPPTNAPVHWVAPKLVCEVRFQDWTDDGVMRFPIFIGLREDKPAHAVHREEIEAAPKPIAPKHENDAMPQQQETSEKKQPPAVPEQTTHAGTAPANRRPILTNLQKVYWPDEGYTKGDLIAYYREVAPVIVPYLRDRPESLNRHPNGIKGKNFFQKDVSHQPPPEWVQTVPLPSQGSSKGRTSINYLLCQDEPTLLFMANLGCIELNPWHSRVGSLDKPDYLIIDLDPEGVPFDTVIDAAIAVRKALDRVDAPSLCKTSGKRGLHIFVPLAAAYSYDQARQFAQIIAAVVHQQLPATTSLIRSPKLRQGRVYLDCFQNARGQTLAAPYSVRPYPGATVSAPLSWREVRHGLDPARFTIRTMAKRLDKVGDLWQPVLGPCIDLIACLERLSKK